MRPHRKVGVSMSSRRERPWGERLGRQQRQLMGEKRSSTRRRLDQSRSAVRKMFGETEILAPQAACAKRIVSRYKPTRAHRHLQQAKVRGGEAPQGAPHTPCSTDTVSNDHFCDYATGLILLAATSQK